MRITALAGGVGGARFLRGLRSAVPDAEITVIGNTGDDFTPFGLHVCPDLDTVMYTLGGGISEEQGWGRAGESHTVLSELKAYGAGPAWFGLGDLDIATHILRNQLLAQGRTLSEVTRTLCDRWQPGVTLLPMSDDPVRTHVTVELDGREQVLHFQEWWVRLHAEIPARAIEAVGAGQARPAPGVLEAINAADFVLLPPSNPVVSVGPDPVDTRHRRRGQGADGESASPRSSAARRCAAWPTPAWPRSALRRPRSQSPLTTGPGYWPAGWSTTRTRKRSTPRTWPASRSAAARCT